MKNKQTVCCARLLFASFLVFFFYSLLLMLLLSPLLSRSIGTAAAEVVFQFYGLLTHIGRMFKHIRFIHIWHPTRFICIERFCFAPFHWKAIRSAYYNVSYCTKAQKRKREREQEQKSQVTSSVEHISAH